MLIYYYYKRLQNILIEPYKYFGYFDWPDDRFERRVKHCVANFNQNIL